MAQSPKSFIDSVIKLQTLHFSKWDTLFNHPSRQPNVKVWWQDNKHGNDQWHNQTAKTMFDKFPGGQAS